jgi:Zn-dependent M28 family amino/carboxypeptidase
MFAAFVALVQTPALEADLRAHVSFLASDLLQGRDTPSPGLDAAAAYLATQFERVGLEPHQGAYHLPATYREKEVRNVIGVIPGAGALKDRWILCTAHYDHIGMRGEGEDTIFNGANDNASGTAGLIEAGRILQGATGENRRSIAFVAFWGEEKGFQGSRAFVAAPPMPLAQIDGVLNLEQIGRTDDSQESTAGTINITGHRFSSLTAALEQGAAAAGLKLVQREPMSSQYFRASDNMPFAAAGIPAHTASSAYSFPDYHGRDDEADRIDYGHLAKAVRAVAAAVEKLASQTEAPQWADLPETAAFRAADPRVKTAGAGFPQNRR